MASRTFGDLAQAAIAKYLKQSMAYEKLVLADTDPENLHQMRVGLRRLRTALQVFAIGVELPKAGREPRVAEIGQKLGELRDLDVIGAILRDRFLPDLPDPEQVLLGQVLDHFDQERRQTFKHVKKLLGGDRYRQTAQALKDWIKAPEYNAVARLPAEQVIPDLALPLVSHLWLHPGWLVGAKVSRTGVKVDTRLSLVKTDVLIAAQGTTLHSLRKQVKRVRYQLRLMADLYGRRLEADIQRLSDMQDTLGHLQDSAVLEQFMTDQIAEARTQMPTLFALLADSRHRAWKQWQTHQQFYLNPEHRQQLRLILLQPDQSAPEPAAARPPAPPKNTQKAARPPA